MAFCQRIKRSFITALIMALALGFSCSAYAMDQSPKSQAEISGANAASAFTSTVSPGRYIADESTGKGVYYVGSSSNEFLNKQLLTEAQGQDLDKLQENLSVQQKVLKKDQEALIEQKQDLENQKRSLAEQQELLQQHKNELADQESKSKQELLKSKENSSNGPQVGLEEIQYIKEDLLNQQKKLDDLRDDLEEQKEELDAQQDAISEQQDAISEQQGALNEKQSELQNKSKALDAKQEEQLEQQEMFNEKLEEVKEELEDMKKSNKHILSRSEVSNGFDNIGHY